MKLNAALAQAFGILRQEGSDDSAASKRFEAELQHAAGRVAAALRERDRVTMSSGFELIASTSTYAVSYQRSRYKTQTDPRQTGGPGVYGDEWRMLLSAFVTVQEAAKDCDDARMRGDVEDLFLKIASRLIAEGEYPAARDITSSLGWLWDDIVAERGYWTNADEDYFLMRIRETANYTVPARSDPLTLRVHAELFCWIFARLVRLALTQNRLTSAKAAISTLLEAREYANASAYQQAFDQAKDATLLSLLGWVLLNFPAKEGEEHLAIANLLINALGSKSAWDTLEHAMDTDFQYSLGVSWWEMEGKSIRGVSGGIIEIDSYIQLAALLAAAQARTMAVPEVEQNGVGDRAWSLAESLKHLNSQEMSRLAPLIPPSQQLERIRQELERAVTRRDEERGRELSESELDVGLVGEFHDGVGETYAETRSILNLLQVAHPETGRTPSFGFNRLENKWWFVHAHVVAEPRQLAESFVRGIKRGEDRAVMDAIRDAVTASYAIISEVPDAMRRWLSGQDPAEKAVILTNSWKLAEALVGQRYNALGDQARLTFTHDGRDVPIYRTADTEPPFASIFTTPGGIAAALGRISAAEPGGVIHREVVQSVVRPLLPEEMELWATEEVPAEQLQQRTIVKVLEDFTVSVPDSSRVSLWTLPEDSY